MGESPFDVGENYSRNPTTPGACPKLPAVTMMRGAALPASV